MIRTVSDMMQRSVVIPEQVKRIISLVPSQTELLYTLGLDEEVIAITKFCIHPEHWFRDKARIGGTKKLHLERIVALEPDLVIANKEENTREEIEWLAERVPVWISDIQTLEDAYYMIRELGVLLGKAEQAGALVQSIRNSFQVLNHLSPAPGRLAYFIWRAPWMCAGGNTFINELLQAGGWTNAFASLQRYPEISEAQLKETAPEEIFLSSEPYPFKEQHIAELQALLPSARIRLVDGELFSWYGSRLLQSAVYFRKLREQQ